MVSRISLLLAQILAQTRQTSPLAMLDFSTAADENRAIARGLTAAILCGSTAIEKL